MALDEDSYAALPPGLAGVELKLGRAKHHLEAIKGKVAEFDHGPDVIPGEYDPQTKTHVFRAQHDPPPPTALSAWIGEFLYNVRCALDYIVVELISLAENPVDRAKAFPIYTDAAAYAKSIDPGSVAFRPKRPRASSGCNRSTDRIATPLIPDGATPRRNPSQSSNA
jgi:hypothetical protein